MISQEHNLYNILIVDDVLANVQLLAGMLSEQGYEVRPINSGKRALQAARAAPPDLILLDVNMPIMNGYEVCLEIKSDPALADIPVIFISAHHETVDKVRGFQVGGVDYITKPFQLDEVLARIETHLKLRWRQLELQRLREWESAYLKQMNALKDEVLSMVSHDLKNPLNNMMGGFYLLQDYLRDEGIQEEQVSRYYGMIESGSDKMQTLIKDVLDLVRNEGRLDVFREPVSINQFIELACRDFVIQAEQQGIDFRIQLLEEDGLVMLDTKRFNRVIQNLIDNAFRYVPEESPQIMVAATRNEKDIFLNITDNGTGIPPENIPHLFEKFYRVRQRGDEGTGLGLAIAKAIVEQHDGRIMVDSELDNGTTFTIVLSVH